MRLLPLALKSLRNRLFTVALTAFTIALSVCLLLGVERIRTQTRESFASTVSGTDLIVGARSGPVNLLLYAIFHIGDATNNVSWQSYKEIAALPDVAWSVPISLGDSHRGYRVVGTTTEFFTHYRYGAKHELAFARGGAFSDLYDTVLGAEVARKLGYKPGDEIIVAHGTGRATIAEHKDKPFRVVGILEPTGTPVDASVFVSLEAIEAIHVDWRYGTRLPGAGVSADAARHMDLTPKTITAFLLGLKSRIATFGVQREINDYEAEPLLAILPGVTLQQLWGLVGIAERALRLISVLVVLVGLAGMLSALVTTLAERRREMAILRALGARPLTIFGLLLLEALLIVLCGTLAGLALLYLALASAQRALLDGYGIAIALTAPSTTELALIGGVLLAGLVAGIVPAALAYRNALADGLTIRT
jgi:putative ABC transport system permease protein